MTPIRHNPDGSFEYLCRGKWISAPVWSDETSDWKIDSLRCRRCRRSHHLAWPEAQTTTP